MALLLYKWCKHVFESLAKYSQNMIWRTDSWNYN